MNNFPIHLTGLRSGETIVSSNGEDTVKKNLGSSITIVGLKKFVETSQTSQSSPHLVYPPLKKNLSHLSKDDMDRLIKYMKRLPFFKDYSDNNVQKWLNENSVGDADAENSPSDPYLNDYGVIVTNVILDGEFFNTTLTEEQRTHFASGIFTIKDIYNACVEKYIKEQHKKDDGRLTLIFRPSMWQVKPPNNVTKFTGHIINLEECTIEKRKYTKSKNSTESLIVLRGIGVPVAVVDPGAKKMTIDELLPLVEKCVDASLDAMHKINERLKPFTPALYKSAIQKIIRSGAKYVVFDDEEYKADIFLLVTYCVLLVHPGVLVPDIQQFVTGLEGAMKRLAISITEDSSLILDNEINTVLPSNWDSGNALCTLLAGALIAKQNKGEWWPSQRFIELQLQYALAAWKSNRCYKYSTKTEIDLVNEQVEMNGHALSYYILKELRSFQSDINLVSAIAKNNGALEPYVPKKLLDRISFYSFIDQHVYTDVCYYVDPNVYGKYSEDNFSTFFRDVWEYSSGINPRKEKYRNVEEIEKREFDFIMSLREGQKLLYLAKTLQATPVQLTNEKIEFEYVIDDSWLAGLIGPQEIRIGKKQYLVSLDPHDIYERKIMIRPESRGAKKQNIEISALDRTHAINIFNGQLERGVRCIPFNSLFWLKRAFIIFKNDTYYIKLHGSDVEYTWDEIKNTSIIIKHPNEEVMRSDDGSKILNSVKYYFNGIRKDGFDMIEKIVSSTSMEEAYRLTSFLKSNKTHIEMHAISRDGFGVEYAPRLIDVRIYQLLCEISSIAPFALRRSTTRRFTIEYAPFLLYLIDLVEERIDKNKENIITSKSKSKSEKGEKRSSLVLNWSPIEDTSGRTNFNYQTDVVTKIVDRFENANRKVHIIDALAGSGKTKMLCEVIKLFINNGSMPRYLIYTCPKSAIATISNELNYYGIDINTVVPIKNKKIQNLEIKPYVANVIIHDHLKHENIINELRAIIPETFFIVDEFHFAMNPTQRTSIALELARCANFCIALSGTPFKDRHTELIIPWLQLAIDFEVNHRNLWTAAGAMIAKRINIGIENEYENIEAKFTKGQNALYNEIMTHKERLNPSTFREVIKMSYEACIASMVEQTLNYVKKNRNVMLVASNIAMQKRLEGLLLATNTLNENQVILINKDNPVSLDAKDSNSNNVKVAITTVRYSTGFTLTKMSVMITSVYFTDQATREQLEARINRVGQPYKTVKIITVHAGILSLILERYETERSISAAIKSLADKIDIPVELLRNFESMSS